MKKKTLIIESVILVTSIILLALFLGLPQMLDLNKRANKQKNISQLTELTLSTNKFLDRYMFSMTADLSRIKEKMEYTQRLNIPGDSKYHYLVYGGVKDADLRFLVSYDLFDLMNQYNKLTTENTKEFTNSVNAYVISAKERMLNSPDSDKYRNYITYLDILLSNLNDKNYFRRAQYTRSIVNPAFDAQKVSIYGSIAQNFVGSGLFKDRNQQAAIILYLCYINQVDQENATAEVFDKFYTDLQNIFNYTSYYSAAAGNPLAEGLQSKDIREMFEEEFFTFFLDSMNYPDRLNKSVIAIGTNATVDPSNRISSQYLNEIINTSYQKEVNQVIDKLLMEYAGNHAGFEKAVREYIDTLKMNDIDRQLVDIYESVFNYLQYQEYLYKSIDSQKANFVQTDFNDKFKDYFHSYILKYDTKLVLNDLTTLLEKEKKISESNLASRFENTNLLRDFRDKMKTDDHFLNAFYRSKSYSDIIAKAKKQFIDNKESAFTAQVQSERLTIDYLKENIDNQKIVKDAGYQKALATNKARWENEFNYIQYLVSRENPAATKANLSSEILADSTNFKRVNKSHIDRITAQLNEAKDSYVRNDYNKYRSLISYVNYCSDEIMTTLKKQRAAEYDEYTVAIVETTSDFIGSSEYPEFDNELVSEIRNNLNDLHRKHTVDYKSITPEQKVMLEELSAKLTNHAEYQKHARANRVANNRMLSKDDLAMFEDVSIDPEGLVYYYNFYLFYLKDKIDKTRFYGQFSREQLQKAQTRYIDNKLVASDVDCDDLEEQIKVLVAANNQEQRAEFTNTMKYALTNYKAFKSNNYKYENAFNFNGLLSDLARSDNKIKFYRGQMEFPFYDKDEHFLIYGRFIEQGRKKIGLSVVSYTDIHNFPKANAVVVRNLGSTNEDVATLQSDLQSRVNTLITNYQNEIVKLSKEREEFKNINVIHNNNPNYKITTQTVQAKKLIRERFSVALEELIEDFVRENY